jgi:sulfide dehydrogenase [flavocytochrome c] flavoprotein chain
MGMTDRRSFLQLGAAAVLAGRRVDAMAAGSAARVVIAGGGFAGGACALELRRISPATAITLIDPHSRYVTCPLSNAVITGQRSIESLTTGRTGLARAGVRVVRARLTALDAAHRRVHLHDGIVVPYDRLVMAPGIRFLFGTPQGYDEAAALRMPHAWEAGPQTQLLAAQLRAMPDGGTVAISVPIGLMRCPPGPYERASLIAHWLSEHRPRSKVLIFDANNHFPRQDIFESAWREQYPGRIEWISPGDGSALERIDVASSTLYSSSGAHRMAVANIIPPQAPASIAADAGLSSGHGWCPTHPETFESELLPGVHVIGDACIAGAMPKSASAARSQGLRCAAAIAAALGGRPAQATELTSVCYSMLAPQSAFAMRARFQSADGDIRQLAADASQSAELTPSAQHVAEAAAWYEDMRRSCLGS